MKRVERAYEDGVDRARKIVCMWTRGVGDKPNETEREIERERERKKLGL